MWSVGSLRFPLSARAVIALMALSVSTELRTGATAEVVHSGRRLTGEELVPRAAGLSVFGGRGGLGDTAVVSAGGLPFLVPSTTHPDLRGRRPDLPACSWSRASALVMSLSPGRGCLFWVSTLSSACEKESLEGDYFFYSKPDVAGTHRGPSRADAGSGWLLRPYIFV